MTNIPTLKGGDGFQMPIIGFGTWQIAIDELESVLNNALEAGYRHIDTAFIYENEHVVGKVITDWIRSGKLTREDLFITTKLPVHGNRAEHVEKFLNLSLKRLQLDYVDLYLIHLPFGMKYTFDEACYPFCAADIDMTTDNVATWKKMEEMVDLGKTKYIGVSNFTMGQVGRILAASRIPPVVNQVQLHAYLQQPELVKYLQEQGIVVTSYSTLGSAGTLHKKDHGVHVPNILDHEVVKSVAAEVGRTPAQVLLRHMMQKGISVIPKSVTPSRIHENFQVFDFQLNSKQMSILDSLDKGFYLVDFRAYFAGIEKHPEYLFEHQKPTS